MNTSVQKLHKGQNEVFRHPSRFRVVVAGRRWGKTHLSRMEIIKCCRAKRRLIWYVAPTYSMARDIMWQELIEVIPRSWIFKMNETKLSIRLINKTEIQLKGADKPDSLRGRGIDFIVADEFQDFRDGVWERVLYPTLTSTRGRALIIGTPKSYNHLHKLYEKGQDISLVRANQWKSWQFPTISSPFIPKTEIIQARKNLDEKSFKQEFEASFESMTGRVYHAFQRKVNVKECPFNPSLPIWVGQDFNVSPMSSVILQPQDNGEVWCVGEVHLMDSSTEDVCQELDRRYWRHKRNLTIFPDPAGGNRNSSRGESDLDVFRDAGYKRLMYRRKHPLVADRINAVNRMFKSADGQSRLFIDHGCPHLIDSLEQTIYKPNSREVDKSHNIEHMADAIGYPIEHQFPTRRVAIAGVSI